LLAASWPQASRFSSVTMLFKTSDVNWPLAASRPSSNGPVLVGKPSAS